MNQALHSDLAGTLRHIAQLATWLVILGLIFVPLERLFALRPAKVWRAETGIDLGYYFLNNLLPTLLLALPVAALSWGLHAALPDGFLSWSEALPVWARFMLALLVVEIGTYWGHRWSHEIPLLWRFHAVHHSAEHMDWLVNTRTHPFDMVFGRFCGLAPLYVLGLAKPMVQGGDALALTVVLVTTLYGFFIHANVRLRLGPLEHLFATPAFHHWHHVRDEHTNRNYATMLPVLDRLFGTLYLPPRWPTAYGIDTPMPHDLFGQLLDPINVARPLPIEAPARHRID